jgi:uncharacterized membrane protein
VALGLYTHLLFILVLAAQGVQLSLTEGVKFTQKARRYLLSVSGGVALFLPWILVMILNAHQILTKSAFTKETLPFAVMAKRWLADFAAVFIEVLDCGEYFSHNLFARPSLLGATKWLVILLVLSLIAYSIYKVIATGSREIRAFILPLILIPAAGLVLPDLMLGGQRSVHFQYLTPCYLGIQLGVVYGFVQGTASAGLLKKRIWQIVIVFLFVGGVVTSGINAQAEVTRNKYDGRLTLQAARIVNGSDNSLVMSSDRGNFNDFLALTRLLDPDVRLLLVKESEGPQIPENERKVFFFRPSKGLISELKEREEYVMNPLPGLYGRLWRLTRR